MNKILIIFAIIAVLAIIIGNIYQYTRKPKKNMICEASRSGDYTCMCSPSDKPIKIRRYPFYSDEKGNIKQGEFIAHVEGGAQAVFPDNWGQVAELPTGYSWEDGYETPTLLETVQEQWKKQQLDKKGLDLTIDWSCDSKDGGLGEKAWSINKDGTITSNCLISHNEYYSYEPEKTEKT